MTDPSIPDASYSALFAYEEDRTRVTPEETIRRIAEPMIAQAFRDEAEHLVWVAKGAGGRYAIAASDIAHRLRTRADALAPVETDAADELAEETP